MLLFVLFFLLFQAVFRTRYSSAGCVCWYKEHKIRLCYLHICLFPLAMSSWCVCVCVHIFSIRTHAEKTPSLFSVLTSEWVPQKYPLQLSSLPHFSISPLSSTLPTPLALSCHSTSLSGRQSVSLVALRCKRIQVAEWEWWSGCVNTRLLLNWKPLELSQPCCCLHIETWHSVN